MPNRVHYAGVEPINPEWDHLRQGTREQFESEWFIIPGGHSQEFQHDLGEVPWVCQVIMSDVATGTFPKDATADVTIVMADEDSTDGSGERKLTVTSDFSAGTDKYFKVRAM